jgi:hypothetical protein
VPFPSEADGQMLCPLLGSRRNQTEPVINRISDVLLDLLTNALSTVT